MIRKINGNKAQLLTDSSKLWLLDAEMLRVVPGKERGGAALAALGSRCLCNSSLKTGTERCFCSSPFFLQKGKSFSDFF